MKLRSAILLYTTQMFYFISDCFTHKNNFVLFQLIMPRKKKDTIWKHFQSFSNRSTKFSYCRKKYTFGNVNKMEEHLKKCFKCPLAVRKGLRNKEDNPQTPILQPGCASSSITTDSTEEQPDITMRCTESPEFTEEKQENLTKLLSKGNICDWRPSFHGGASAMATIFS